ncbi:MAG: DNA recombination protein RmuC [Actinobacteria bacterium]|nr:DNA recombination protein RmuC [Actinomycetota bacterium]
MLVLAILLLVAAGLAVGGVVLARSLGGQLGGRLQQLDGTLGELESRLDRRLGDLDAKVDRRLEGLDGRLLATQRNAGESATKMAAGLARVEEGTRSMLERANDLKRLEQALRPPKARGGFGELLLANLLADMLPPSAYELQYGFVGGERVDAVIRAEKLLPVDAKFPLDNLHRVLDAEDDEQRLIARRALARDVKGHVDAIATKYVKPGEGTYDFAFMYLPAETIYYEIACGGTGDLQQYALARRVFPVSPATFHAYLTMIVIGLRGLQIEKHAEEVMAYCGQLVKDFTRFREDFDVVGKHIGNAQGKYGDAQRRLDRFETRLEQAVDEDALEERAAGLSVGEQLRAIDAA